MSLEKFHKKGHVLFEWQVISLSGLEHEDAIVSYFFLQKFQPEIILRRGMKMRRFYFPFLTNVGELNLMRTNSFFTIFEMSKTVVFNRCFQPIDIRPILTP